MRRRLLLGVVLAACASTTSNAPLKTSGATGAETDTQTDLAMVMLPTAVAVAPDAFANALVELGGGAVQDVE